LVIVKNATPSAATGNAGLIPFVANRVGNVHRIQYAQPTANVVPLIAKTLNVVLIRCVASLVEAVVMGRSAPTNNSVANRIVQGVNAGWIPYAKPPVVIAREWIPVPKMASVSVSRIVTAVSAVVIQSAALPVGYVVAQMFVSRVLVVLRIARKPNVAWNPIVKHLAEAVAAMSIAAMETAINASHFGVLAVTPASAVNNPMPK
jgi:hypothetical protein